MYVVAVAIIHVCKTRILTHQIVQSSGYFWYHLRVLRMEWRLVPDLPDDRECVPDSLDDLEWNGTWCCFDDQILS